jgi:uncharacterized protein involved in high-affinity Fe2+ transport|tara:strand:- start:5146 stop:5346 length:201 start_codon:yes stop_codon:yes gene_type:complete
MKGYRTIVVNAVSIIVMVAAAAMQYADQLPITSEQAGMLGMCASIVMGIANLYLRSVTTTPVGKSK